MQSSHVSFYRASILTLVVLAGAVVMPAQTTPQSLPNSTTPGQPNPNSTKPRATIPNPTNPDASGQAIPGANPAANADNLAISPGNSHLTDKETQFLNEALKGGRHEVAMAQLALTKGSNAEVKSFAQRLANDHSTANKRLETIAGKNGITIPAGADGPASVLSSADSVPTPRGSADVYPDASTRPDATARRNPLAAPNPANPDTTANLHGPVHGSMDTRLASLSGAEFDRAFVKQMVDDHEQTIAKFETAQNDVTDAELRGFIASTLPTLRQHLQQARAQETEERRRVN